MVLSPLEQEKGKDPVSLALMLILPSENPQNRLGIENDEMCFQILVHLVSAVTSGEYLTWKNKKFPSGKWSKWCLASLLYNLLKNRE